MSAILICHDKLLTASKQTSFLICVVNADLGTYINSEEAQRNRGGCVLSSYLPPLFLFSLRAEMNVLK